MIVDELNSFRDKLMIFLQYRRRIIDGREKLTKEEWAELTSVDNEIRVNAGKYAPLVKEYTGLETIHTSAGLENVWDWAFSFEPNTLVVSALDKCYQATSRTIGKLEDDITRGVRDKQGNLIEKPSSKISLEPPKVFVAHGGKSEARDKLYRFLTALGITPLVIEEEPKEGRSVNEQVEYYSEQAHCAVVLGTADDKELKDGKLYPRRNVHIEIGRFQEKFPNRIIFLLEEGASFPSDISEKLYTRFTQESMDEAFIAVATELKAFGMLKVVKP
jgi:predicted nucleotide-binding protein